jgi:hypothetical protein
VHGLDDQLVPLAVDDGFVGVEFELARDAYRLIASVAKDADMAFLLYADSVRTRA